MDDNILDEGVTGQVYPIHGEGEVMMGGTEVADVSWVVPAGQITTACFVLGAPGHSRVNTANSGMSIGHESKMHAGKPMAVAGAELIQNPDLIAQAKAEFAESTRGRPYQNPIPAHLTPRTAAAAD